MPAYKQNKTGFVMHLYYWTCLYW